MRVKFFTFSFVFLFFFVMTGSSWATSTTLADVLNGVSYASQCSDYLDTGVEAVSLTDTDGTTDDATVFLLLELAGYKDTNVLGIYGFTYDNEGNVVLGETLQVFAGSASSVTSTTLAFDLEEGTVTNSTTGESATIGTTFGFYISTQDGYTFYTHTVLNEDGQDHALVFDTSDNSVGSLLGSDVVIGFEDLNGLGDGDFNDMVIGVSDVTPAPVPEPATMLLLGSGLLGMGIFRKKKNN